MVRFLPLVAILGCQAHPGPVAPGRLDTLPVAQRLADEGVARWPSDALALSWIETVWHVGLVRLHERDGDPRWEAAWRAWLDRGVTLFTGADPRVFDSSDSLSPSTLASVAMRADPAAGYDPILSAAWQYLDHDAKTLPNGAITHWGEPNLVADDDEVWVDSLFMVGMFLLAEYDRTGDEAVMDRFVAQYEAFSELCRDPEDQLYRHAYKAATDANIPPDEVYWARGNSWVLIAAAEGLSRLPEGDPRAERLRAPFVAHADAVMALQADDGLWHTVLNSPLGDDPANYTETSAAALIAYALVKGDPWLDPDVSRPAVAAAVGGLRGRLVERDGELSLSGTSFGTNPGDYAYYVAVPQLDDQVLGVGSVVMFFAEAHGLEIGGAR